MMVWATIERLLRTQGRCALVSVVKIEGSAPREAGARMVVSAEGYSGSIGGGALEWKAIAAAQAMLAQPPAARHASVALGPELGQCCGGRVELFTEVFDASALPLVASHAERERSGAFTITGRIVSPQFVERFGEERRPLYVFGSGHVGRAMILALAPLPFAVMWIDSRAGAFPSAVPGNVTCVGSSEIGEITGSAPTGSFALVVTHSHALDLAIVELALRNLNFSYVGLIGSATKRARFERRLREANVPPARIAELVCPIGLPQIRSKLPAIIAASTVVQLLERDELLRSGKNPVNMPEAPARMAQQG
jgi:xanthine dehydrogenase accessory factor